MVVERQSRASIVEEVYLMLSGYPEICRKLKTKMLRKYFLTYL